VMFMSDNGGSGGTSSGPLRGGKGSCYEGGQRTPFLVWWPETIPAGKVTGEIAISFDLLPTFAKLCGGKLSDNTIDGKNISDLFLKPDAAQSPHNQVSYKGRGYRLGNWKIVGNELYNLANDIGEQNTVAKQHPDKFRELAEKRMEWIEIMERERRPHANMPDPSPLVSEEQANALPGLKEWLNNKD